jgi:hypothetical protein
MRFSRKTTLLTAQPAMLKASQVRAVPAPPVYRPQPVPKVLQTKTHHSATRSNPVMENAPSRPVQPATGAFRKKTTNDTSRPNMSTTRSVITRQTSAVVQAVKLYPNLHPGAIESVDPSNIFRLNSFANQYRLHKQNSHGVNVPNQQYNFVRTHQGEMLLHSRYRHPSIAEGKQVLYAGEIYFNNGQLEWWSNGSGHYQPFVEDAEQANLPMDHFYSYQQILKGEHMRKKGRK